MYDIYAVPSDGGTVVNLTNTPDIGSVQKVLQKKEVMVRGWISKPQPRIEP